MPKPDLEVHPTTLPKIVTAESIGVREDVLFTDKNGQEKSGIRKRAENALNKLGDPLRKILEPSEVVLYVARAHAPATLLEQMTMGWYIYDAKRCVLILTNRRLLQFGVRRRTFGGELRWDWRGSGIRSVAWGDVEEAKVKGWLSPVLHLKYRGGKKEKFWSFRGQDARKIRLLLEKLLPNSTGENTAVPEPVMKCPNCVGQLMMGNYRCSPCDLQFKDPRTATVRSVVIPGGGYFYVGETTLGIVDALVESIFLLALLLLLLEVAVMTASGEKQPPGTWAIVIYLLVVLAIEKLITIYHARKAVETYIPVKP